ncbi:MAG: lipopolysaccharide heptosyltransferase II [Woeseiaceae bacterium]
MPVLVVGPSWVGDMVMAQSLFRRLKQQDPDQAIDVVAPAWSLPVLARMPEVRTGVALDVAHGEFGFGKRRRLGHELRKNGYARAIVLPRSAKAALVPWHANIPIRTGFRGELRFGLINDVRPFDKAVLNQTVKRFVALGLATADAMPMTLPRPKLTIDPVAQAAALRRLNIDQAKPLVGLLPGAEYGPAKCWPLPHFASLASLLAKQGFQVGVFGGPKDHAGGEQIVAMSNGDAVNYCGETALAEVIDVLAACEHVVTNDSGLMHVAAAVDTSIVALYGSTSPDFTPPLTTRATIMNLALDCSPCFKRECPLGHLNCLNGIVPTAVLSALNVATKQ